MVTDLGGEDLEVFRNGSSGTQTRLMTIHKGRHRFRHVVGLNKLTPEQVAEITPENGWFVFGVLRDPWSRLWSAWQSKFLVRHNRYRNNFEGAPFWHWDWAKRVYSTATGPMKGDWQESGGGPRPNGGYGALGLAFRLN